VFALSPVDATALPAPSARSLQSFEALKNMLDGRASNSAVDRLSYARDMWPLALLWIRQQKCPPPPDVVVWPTSEEEIVNIIQLARQQKLPVIPFGAGSGVCGGTWALRGGISLDLKKLDSISSVDPVSQTVTVGSGVMGETLERRLNAGGYTLGHFPSSIYTSTVGGWLAARSAGQLSSRYGKIEDMVVSARVVLGTGERAQSEVFSNNGPSQLPLWLGSEGTLCVFTQVCLRVFPKAEAQVFRAFEMKSVEVGLEAIRLMFREGLRPAVVRLYDPFDSALASNSHSKPEAESPAAMTRWALTKLRRHMAPHTLGHPVILNRLQKAFSKSRLILMFEGEPERSNDEEKAARAVCLQLGAVDLGQAPGKVWLKKRYDVSYRMSTIIDAGAFADAMEVAAPWSKVLAVYSAVRKAAAPFAFVLCHFSHAYVEGCSLYFSFLGAASNERESEVRYHRLWTHALSAALAAGGNVSHHHGVGIHKAEAFQRSLGAARPVLQALKRRCDPDGILNPHKLGLE
jgi:alkyldihydroxyacetonephosphate synthase